MNETKIDIPKIIATDFQPNTNNLISANPVAIFEFKILHNTFEANIDKIKQINTITIDSLKKILNTSIPRAPTARNIPISFFLLEIDIEMKLNISNVEKTANTIPTYKKTDFKV